MHSAPKIEMVFLDTQVFVNASFNFSTTAFAALRKHFQSGRLRLLMTDVTLAELKSNIQEEVTSEIALQQSFIKKARFLKSSSLAEAKAATSVLNAEVVSADIYHQLEQFMGEGRAMTTGVDCVSPGPIFAKYFAGAPPFGSDGEKKFEFPDAFVIAALAEWAEPREEFMFIVSGDDLFREGCKKFVGLVPMKTLVELLDHIASEEEKRAEFVRRRVKDDLQRIIRKTKKAFEDNYFWVEDEDGEATVTVDDCELVSGPKIIVMDSDMGSIQLKFNVHYTAHLNYLESATSVYDKETDKLIYAERREQNVQRSVILTVEVQVSFDEGTPDNVSVDDVVIVSPSGGFAIEIYEPEDWPHR